jgi:hypothetical protein
MSFKHSPYIQYRIQEQDGCHLNKECKRGGKFGDIKLFGCRIRSIWLGNGFLSFIRSVYLFLLLLLLVKL